LQVSVFNKRGSLKDRLLKLVVALCAAATLAIGMTAGYPPTWRFYVGMPGLAIGLIFGWAIDIPQAVYVVGFLSNAFFYYGAVKVVLAVARRLARSGSNKQEAVSVDLGGRGK
jgi:hypothetical protein